MSVLNSQDMDCALTCSYDKIREYQLSLEKEKITDCLRGKVDNLNKLLPVKEEHIRYLTEELNKMAFELIQEKKEVFLDESPELLQMQFKEWIQI